MADIQSTDQFLVNRSDLTQTVDHAELMAELQDTDLMLVNRADQTYTITGEDLKDSLKPDLELTVVLSTYDPGVGNEITATAIGGGGTPPFTYTYQWEKGGVDIAGATTDKYTPVVGDIGSKLKCTVEATDDDGDTITASSLETNAVVATAVAPEITDVALAEQTPETPDRFTSQKFDFTVACKADGTVPMKFKAKAKVTGDLNKTPVTDEITAVDATTLTFSGDKDLDLFTAGDVVTQDSGYTANTSEITGLGLSDYLSDVTSSAKIEKPERMFDGDKSKSAYIASGQAWIEFTPSIPFPYTTSVEVVGSGDPTPPEKTRWQLNDGPLIESANSFSFVTLATGSGTVTKIRLQCDQGGINWSAIKIDGNILIDGAPTFTLDDDSELSNLRPGDFITQENSTPPATYAIASYRADDSNTEIPYNNSPDAGATSPEMPVNTYFWADLGSTKDVKSICFEVAGLPADDPVDSGPGISWIIQYTNDPSNMGSSLCNGGCTIQKIPVVTRLANGNLRVEFNDILRNDGSVLPVQYIGVTNGANSYGGKFVYSSYSISVETSQALNPSGTVGSISGSTITLSESNGTWGPANDGHNVVAQLQPGTAKFGSTSGNSMTLTDNDDSPNVRWIPGKGKIAVGPTKSVENTTQWLAFKADGDGTLVPPYLLDDEPNWVEFAEEDKTSAAWTITFPATFADGDTPDEDLPTDTTLCVRTEVTNDGGTAPLSDQPAAEACKTPIASVGPNATMHGLRFDKARDTRLQRSFNVTQPWTCSFWIKQTNLSAAVIVGCNHSNHVYFDGTNWRLSGILSGITGSSGIKNEWQHIIGISDGSYVRLWQDGVEITTAPGVSVANPFAPVDFSISGNLRDGTWQNTLAINGYLSDLYWVDGQVITDPTTFGDNFEGKWGPLDSAVVKQNIIDAKEVAFPDANTSEVWSAVTVANDPSALVRGTPQESFDGSTDTEGYRPQGGFKTTFASPISVSSKVVLYFYGNQDSSGNVIYNEGLPNEETVAYSFSGVADGLQFGETTSLTSLSSIKVTGTSSSETNYIGFTAAEVDGEILVDGGFGANGFFLPFDPEATGVNWSNMVSGSPSISGGEIEKAFDGNESTQSYTSSGTSNYQIFSPTDFPLSDGPYTVEAKTYGLSYNLNGTGDVTSNEFTETVNEFTSLRVNASDIAGAGWFFIKVNGNLLVDHNNIGVDASGNGNNFHGENFAVGNSSQVWSSNTSDTWGLPLSNAFDGDTSSTGAYSQAGQSATVNFTGITATSIQVGGTLGNTGNSWVVTTSDGTFPLIWTAGVYTSFDVPITGATAELISIENTDGSGQLRSVVIDGSYLIDANIQDTVLDTPMLDYAVLTAGKNGNLVADAGGTSLSYLGKAGTLYYYEQNGAGKTHEGGSSFSSTDGVVYNFGQQPFANQYDSSQAWSPYLTFSGPEQSSATNAFDGNLSTSAKSVTTGAGYSTSIDFIPEGGLAYTGSVKIYCKPGQLAARINGGSWVTFSTEAVLATGSGTINSIEVTEVRANAGYDVCGYEVDGKILLNPVNNSQVWSDYGNTTNMQESWTASFNGVVGPDSSDQMALPNVGGTSLVDFTSLDEGGISYNTLRVYVARDSKAPDLFVNDTDLNITPISSSSGYVFEWKTISGPGLLTNLGSRTRTEAIQGGSGFGLIEVDGKVLVDPASSGIAGALGNELKQTWLEWNKVVTLFINNPADVATFNAIKDELDAYPGNVRAAREALVTKILKTRLTDEEKNQLVAALGA